MLNDKEPTTLILTKLEKIAKRLNVIVRKLNTMGLQTDEQKEYYELSGNYSFLKLRLADRVFDREVLPTLHNDESTKLSLILKSKLKWDTSLLMTSEEIDKVSQAYNEIKDKNLINKVLNNYFGILTNNLIKLFDDLEEENDTDTEESILNMGKLLTTYNNDISLFEAKKLIHDHLLYKFETIYMILAEDEQN